jgi:hypothetical protein
MRWNNLSGGRASLSLIRGYRWQFHRRYEARRRSEVEINRPPMNSAAAPLHRLTMAALAGRGAWMIPVLVSVQTPRNFSTSGSILPDTLQRHLSLPQSSSVSPFTAGASAFFILSQSGERPVLSQRRAFHRSTSIARRLGRKSIWATRSALVFGPRLLRLGRAAIGSYWSLPATEYRSMRQKTARGSLQPQLAFPSERQASGQSTNIARRRGRRSISATLSARVFAPRRPRPSSWQLRTLRVPDAGQLAGARRRIQRFPIRVGIESVLGPASAQLARKSEG